MKNGTSPQSLHKLIDEIDSTIESAIITSNIVSDEHWMLNVKVGTRLFVMEHAGKAGYGVTEVLDKPESWISGYDNVYSDLKEALKYLYSEISKKNKNTRKQRAILSP